MMGGVTGAGGGKGSAADGWHEVVSGRREGFVADLGRTGLWAAAQLYGAGLAGNHAIYDLGLKAQTKPALPTVSVGNLTLGGTGKTTAAAYLAGRLAGKVKTAIILRGYRRKAEEGPLLVADGEEVVASVGEAGDEATMLARALPGCVVAVGKRRERVIECARDAGAQVAILDDGLQYFRMERAADVVLVDALADLNTWRLFPAGVLREPLGHVRRATQVWLTHCDLAGEAQVSRLRELVAAQGYEGEVVTTRHKTGRLRSLSAGGVAPDSLAGRKVLAVCELGNPEAFVGSVKALGARVTGLAFPDHHAYEAGDYEVVMLAAERSGAELVVTTEKDAVKLPSPREGCVPVAVLGCELEVLSGGEAVEGLVARMAELATF